MTNPFTYPDGSSISIGDYVTATHHSRGDVEGTVITMAIVDPEDHPMYPSGVVVAIQGRSAITAPVDVPVGTVRPAAVPAVVHTDAETTAAMIDLLAELLAGAALEEGGMAVVAMTPERRAAAAALSGALKAALS